MPIESSSYYARGMTMKCRHCGYSGLPLTLGACIYDKIKIEKPEKPKDIFESELSPQGVLSKLAMISLLSFLVSIWSPGLRSFSAGAFLAFFAFSFAYGFLRLKNG